MERRNCTDGYIRLKNALALSRFPALGEGVRLLKRYPHYTGSFIQQAVEIFFGRDGRKAGVALTEIGGGDAAAHRSELEEGKAVDQCLLIGIGEPHHRVRLVAPG